MEEEPLPRKWLMGVEGEMEKGIWMREPNKWKEGREKMRSFDRGHVRNFDAEMVVEDEVFCVKKHTLADDSELFKTLFLIYPVQGNTMRVRLPEVTAPEFQIFLECLIYGRIDDDVVEPLVRLSKKYSSKSVKNRCEEHLMSSPTMSMREVFGIAMKHDLPKVKEFVISQVKTANQARAIVPSSQDQTDSWTHYLLLQKAGTLFGENKERKEGVALLAEKIHKQHVRNVRRRGDPAPPNIDQVKTFLLDPQRYHRRLIKQGRDEATREPHSAQVQQEMHRIMMRGGPAAQPRSMQNRYTVSQAQAQALAQAQDNIDLVYRQIQEFFMGAQLINPPPQQHNQDPQQQGFEAVPPEEHARRADYLLGDLNTN